MTTFQYNGHSYLLSNSGTWQQAQAEAQRLGGNLVTINDQAEQDWLTTTFGTTKNLWIGYTDQATEGVFKWISGEDSTYTYWNGGEPNNAGNSEDYAHLENWSIAGRWNDNSNYSPMRGIIELADDSIFNAQGSGITEAGVIRVMADFAKAAYALQSWEDNTKFFTGLNAAFNDKSDKADTAYQDILDQGWQPLDSGIPQVNGTFECIDHSKDVITPTIKANNIISNDTDHSNDSTISLESINGMVGGYYTNQNAAAFVARYGDAIVLAFRGTNDNRAENADSGVINPDDTTNGFHPDVDQWGSLFDGSSQSMSDHYALFNSLITGLDAYVANNGINHVYVTGHSLGGAMAIEYMADPKHSSDVYQAVTFAAPAFTESDFNRAKFNPNINLLQIEVANDPVPMTWDVGSKVEANEDRPGDVIRFSGDHTLDPNEDFTVYDANANYHSMDYYRAITDNIDANSWQTILKPTTLAQISNQEVYLGGTRTVSNRVETFTVATNADLLTAPTDSNYTIIYGGGGNDTLTGGKANELLIGGRGRDVLRGELGADTFVFNTVSDSGAVNKLRDVIIDFLTGTDKIDLSGMDANNTTAENDAFLSLTTGVKNVTFNLTNALYFNTASHILYGNNDTDTAADFSISLSGVTSLTTSDFIL